MNKSDFLDYVKNQCLTDSIDFKTFEGDKAYTIMANSPCSGFFEENETITPTLGIALNLSERLFFEILAHEFSHSRQWKEKDPTWTLSRLTTKEQELFSQRTNLDCSSFETGDILDLWWERKLELSPEESLVLTKRTVAVEYDCETRTVALIKTLGLNLDPKEYAKKANSYVGSYFFARKHRRFTTPGHSAYTKPEVWSLFPEEMDLSFCENLPNLVEEAIFKYCIKD